jgi:NitT/TauT family transport system permease protein
MTTVLETPRVDASQARPLKRLFNRTLATLGTVVLWFVFTEVVNASNPILSFMGPLDVLVGIKTLFTQGVLMDSIAVSLFRLVVGLVVSIVFGVLIGLAFGLRKSVEHAFGLVVQFLRMTSPLAWAPIAVMLFGIGTKPVVFLISLAAIWPIALATTAGVRAVDPGWLQVAQSLGATSREVIINVVAPAISSHVLTGIRLAIGIGWVVLVPAEMLGVDSGLGFLILNARDQLAYDLLASTMFVIGLVGFFLDLGAQKIFRSITA